MGEELEDGITAQLGLLDLEVDLSVPEVYAGPDFTLYLHIRNPFSHRVWVRSVELSLPTQLSWRDPSGKRQQGADDKLRARISSREAQIAKLKTRLESQVESRRSHAQRLRERIAQLEAQVRADRETLSSEPGVSISVEDDAAMDVYKLRGPRAEVHVGKGAALRVEHLESTAEPERVPLTSSLPRDAALAPGSTDVWTIRLGSGRSPFVLPAMYHLQLTVIYSRDPLAT